jgi:hypothetical protein
MFAQTPASKVSPSSLLPLKIFNIAAFKCSKSVGLHWPLERKLRVIQTNQNLQVPDFCFAKMLRFGVTFHFPLGYYQEFKYIRVCFPGCRQCLNSPSKPSISNSITASLNTFSHSEIFKTIFTIFTNLTNMASGSSPANTGQHTTNEAGPIDSNRHWGLEMTKLIPHLKRGEELKKNDNVLGENDAEQGIVADKLENAWMDMIDMAFRWFFVDIQCVMCKFHAQKSPASSHISAKVEH